MTFRCQVGDSVFLNDNGGGHRWVVITKPNKDGKVVMVNFTSAATCPDTAVLFTRNDDKELFSKPTRIHYKYADIFHIKTVMMMVNSTAIVSDYKSCKETIVTTIIDGAFRSEFTSFAILDELKEQYPKRYEKFRPLELKETDFIFPT